MTITFIESIKKNLVILIYVEFLLFQLMQKKMNEILKIFFWDIKAGIKIYLFRNLSKKIPVFKYIYTCN